MKLKSLTVFISFLIFATSANAKTFWGPRVRFGFGSAGTFAETSFFGKLRSIGIELSEAAVIALPDQEMTVQLIFPPNARSTHFDHAEINWNPHGHDPVQIYGQPHFDFHFYTLSKATQAAITCTGTDMAICMTPPTTSLIPPFYAPTPAGVPLMGWHWFDTRSPEFHGTAFTKTFIYGYYNGQVAFLEPMITLKYLMEYHNETLSLVTPSSKIMRFPKNYSIRFIHSRRMYQIVMENF
jgi:hypothetical protein